MTPDELAKFKQFLSLKVKNPVCPDCGSNAWDPAGPFSFLQSSDGALQIGGGGMPVVTLVCNKCCHVRTYAWLGILRVLEAERVKTVVGGSTVGAK